MKSYFCTVCGMVLSGILYIYGGWSESLLALLIFMSIDYISGLLVAFYNSSNKTLTGAISSFICYKGIIKKIAIILYVAVGHQLDLLLDIHYIRECVCIAFIVSELISIIENAGILGVPVPSVIKKGIEILKEKTEE